MKKAEASLAYMNRPYDSGPVDMVNVAVFSGIHIPLGVLIVENVNGQDLVSYSNAEFQKISGYTEEELLGMPTSRLYLPEDWADVVDRCKKMMSGIVRYPSERRLLRKGKDIAWVMKVATPIKYSGREAIIGYFMDITGRKAAANRIEQLNSMLNVMLDIKHLIVRQKNLDHLMQGICDCLVSRSGYHASAIFLLSQDRSVLKSYQAGECRYHSVHKDYASADLPICANLALGTSNIVWLNRSNKYSNDCLLANCSTDRKIGSVRLKHGKTTYGVLVVSVSEALSKMWQERNMLKDIADDISIAINTIRQTNVRIVLQKRLQASERELTKLNENMRSYIQEITEAQEHERNRISHDLHDDTVQKLASMKLDLFNIMCEESLAKSAQQKIEGVLSTLGTLLDDINKICYRLRPGPLDQLGLSRALELLGKDSPGLNHEVTHDFEVIGKPYKLDTQVETNLYRIAQEAMNNIAKHSKADSVRILLAFEKNRVRLSIIDNGIGFKKPRKLGDFVRYRKLGLTGMQERVHLIKGQLQIRSSIGRGTSVTVTCPQ